MNNKPYYTLDSYFKKTYGGKVFKVSLNAGFTCPNIDGTKEAADAPTVPRQVAEILQEIQRIHF